MYMTEINKQAEIQFLEDDVEAVRKLPDVYIGALGNAGYKNMVREIMQNCFDARMKGEILSLIVNISYDMRNHTCIIEDNGQGIDLSKLARVFSVLHSSSNYDKIEGSGQYSSGKNGMGATITNYLSKFFVVESYRMDGSAKRVKFEEGKLIKEEDIKCPNGKHGLITSFAPSEMMGNITVTDDEIYYLTWLLCNLCAIGTIAKFNSIDNMGQKKSLTIKNTRGIYEFIDTICEKKVFEPIYFVEDNGSMKLEFLLTYDIKNMDDPNIMSFANTCPTNGGTHVDGFMDAVVKYFRDYMNKIYLANNKKLTVTAQDIRTGLRAVVSCFHIKPMFTGQSKEIFSKEDMKPYAYSITLKGLDNWAQSNPADLQKISKYLKEVCEIRTKSEGEKIKMSDKYTASVVTGMPAKYKKPNGKGAFEVIIGEGDSAISGMENNRDKMTQGLFPIRGKILNAFTTPVKKFFENEEISGMFKIFGYNGYSKSFDPTKFRPSKVIIATDADADGKHIESLLMMLFIKYLPFVILEGKLYCANPPLYGISIGKDKMKFFADNIEYIEYVQDLFCKDNKIESANGKTLTKKDITNILYRNIDYIKFMNHVSNTYSIDPWLLEFILYNIDLMKDFSKFKRAIEKQYKFTKVTMENNMIMIRGLVGSKFQTVFCNQMLFTDAQPIIDLINRSDNYYKINGNKSSIYDLMLLFNSFEPKSLTRYKGLGEMPPKQLGISTVLPGMGRILKQYTIDDVKKQLNYIRDIQSDKSAFLKNVSGIRKEDII